MKKTALALGVVAVLLASPAALAAKKAKKGDTSATGFSAVTDSRRDPRAATARGPNECVIDLAGATSNGATGNSGNTIIEINLGAGAAVTSIGNNYTVTAHSPSWRSEARLQYRGEDPLGAINFTPGLPNSSGTSTVDFPTIDLSDYTLPDIETGASGLFYVEAFESYDDTSINPDATYDSGSTTVYYTGGDPYACSDEEPEPTITCADEGYKGTQLKWCQEICENGNTGSTLDMWIRRWISKYRKLPACAAEGGEEPPQQGES